MTRHFPLWLQAQSYAATVDRRLIGSLWPGARSTGLACTAQPGTMIVNVAPGSVAIPANNGSGSVLCVSDGLEQTELVPAGITGQNRRDIIVAYVHSNELGAGSGDAWTITNQPGNFGTDPLPPNPQPGTVVLAEVYVAGGSAAIANTDITDRRPGHLAVPGPPGPVAPAVPGIQSFTDSSGEAWVARGGVNGGFFRRARDVVHARVYRSAEYTPAATLSLFVFDTAERDPYSLHSNGLFTCPVAGWYHVTYFINHNLASVAGQFMNSWVSRNGAQTQAGPQDGMVAGRPNFLSVSGSATLYANAGETLSVLFANTSAPQPVRVGLNNTSASFDYLGGP